MPGAAVSQPPGPAPLVSVVLVTYRTPERMLWDCLDAVAASTYRPLEMVLVDNSSDDGVELAIGSWERPPGSSPLPLRTSFERRNLGYAAGTNLGIRMSRGELVLLLNPDALVEPETIRTAVEAAARRPDVTGFAPKILLALEVPIIDSVGIDLLAHAEGRQRGLGEPDAGQFDREESVAGLCFAAALVRRSAFGARGVGLLDARYFMFYEDVDWSLRAAIEGHRFISVPGARVRHVHSASTRELDPSFKTRLIQRNLIWTAAKNLESPGVVRVVLADLRRFLGADLRRGRRRLALGVGIESLLGIPRLLRSRRQVQRRRRAPDREVFSDPGVAPSFDVETYRPLATARSLFSVLSRLASWRDDPGLAALVERLRLALEQGPAASHRDLASEVRRSGIPLTPGLLWLVRELESDGAG